jgi:hypothetical protein
MGMEGDKAGKERKEREPKVWGTGRRRNETRKRERDERIRRLR